MMRQKLDSPVAVTRSSLPPLEEYVDMLKPLWESAWLTNMGDYHEQFKEQLKEYLMIPELELFVNGHMALELALQALDLRPGRGGPALQLAGPGGQRAPLLAGPHGGQSGHQRGGVYSVWDPVGAHIVRPE